MRNLNRHLLARVPVERPYNVTAARAEWADFRFSLGMARSAVKLLTAPEGNYKFAKTPVPVYGLSLAPADASEAYNACTYRTRECTKGCVAYAGQGEAPNVLVGRALKTMFLGKRPSEFMAILDAEIYAAKRKHGAKGEQIGVRLNAFSDLEWERIVPWLFEEHGDVQFYDYTKFPHGARITPSNYHLTYSVSERTTDEEIRKILNAGDNVAMVLDVAKGEPMPEKIAIPVCDGLEQLFVVVDGDASDARYVDVSMGSENGVVIGLRPKGRMRKFPVGKGHMVRNVKESN